MNALCLLLGVAFLSVDGGTDAGNDAGAAGRPPITESGAPHGGSLDAGTLDARPATRMDGRGTEDAASTFDAAAPHGRAVGKILVKGARDVIFGARVEVISAGGKDLVVETDEDGRFDVVVPCGLLAFSVSAPGFDSVVERRDVCAESAPLLVRLIPRANVPVYETVVIGKPDELSVGLRGPELVTTPGSLGDPLRVIDSLPGVASVAWPTPILAVRGSNPGNTGYFLDDIALPQLFHFALGPAVIHPYFFDSMAFYPGGYPARYGRYVAGIVAAQTREGSTDRAHASVDVRLYDTGVFASVPFSDENGAVAAAFRYSYTAALLSALQKDLKLSYWDYQLRADRRAGAWRLGLLVMGSDDTMEVYGNPWRKSTEVTMVFHRASLRAERALGPGRLQLRLSFGLDRNSAPILEDTQGRQRAYSVAPRASYAWYTHKADFELGVDSQAQWLRSSNDANEVDVTDLARNRTAWLLGAYASSTVRPARNVALTPSLRFDSYTISGITKTDWGPRLSARVGLGQRTWLAATGGRFSQAPSVGRQIPAGENFGLGFYGLQTSWQGALGIGTEYIPSLAVEVTGFAQRSVLTDLRDPGINQIDPFAPDLLVRRDARAYGLEVMIRRPASERLYGWLSYTLSRSERAFSGRVVGPSDWDQRHVLNAVLGYRWGRNTFGARGHFNTGRPMLVSQGTVESFVRLPAFYQLDLRAERRFVFDSFTLSAYLEIVNATGSRSVVGLERMQNGEIVQDSFRIFLPSLGLRGEL